MRGYVTKKGNRYYAVIYDGVDTTTGKEKRRWIAAGTRKGDAEKIVTDMVKRRQQGETVSVDKTTLGVYLVGRWLPIQQSKIRTSTWDSYRRNIDLHVIPALGQCPLDKLTADEEVASGSSTGKRLLLRRRGSTLRSAPPRGGTGAHEHRRRFRNGRVDSWSPFRLGTSPSRER